MKSGVRSRVRVLIGALLSLKNGPGCTLEQIFMSR
jgi:hypothetical protein